MKYLKHHTPTEQHKRRSDQMKLDLAGPAEDISRQQAVNRNFTGKGQCAEREVFLVFAHLKGPIVVLDLPSCSATRYAGSGSGPTQYVVRTGGHFSALAAAPPSAQQ